MKYLISVFAGAISYGILSTIVVKAYAQGYQLGEVVGAQLLTGFILSWILAMYTKRRSRRPQNQTVSASATPSGFARLTWKQRLLLMLAGAPTVVTGLLYYQSLRYNPASLSIVLLFQFTWISVLIQAVITRRRPSNIMLWTLLILFGGTFLAAGIIGQGTTHFNGVGIIFGLLSAISYSLFILFSGKVVPSVHPTYRSAWMVTGGFVLLCILFPPHFLFNGMIWSSLMLFGFLLGLFGAFIPPLLFAIGVPRIGEAMAGILGAAELPVAVLLSTIVLHEDVNGLQWVGVVLILIGVTLPELYKLRGQNKKLIPS
ncbi:EamA family transporter [Paenibacillus sp. JX-17]|uniref:EamA family transporter n=1 Tax=Paenibacillus lacisoli TaxID=3064525 RepID=A0ABT9CD98_9BACL|nr:EamA family transporter [Paenibacillus sp. JX-17]MDO7907245.1 EamA family transporter [Paenibacillus sp. JX-17]